MVIVFRWRPKFVLDRLATAPSSLSSAQYGGVKTPTGRRSHRSLHQDMFQRCRCPCVCSCVLNAAPAAIALAGVLGGCTIPGALDSHLHNKYMGRAARRRPRLILYCSMASLSCSMSFLMATGRRYYTRTSI